MEPYPFLNNPKASYFLSVLELDYTLHRFHTYHLYSEETPCSLFVLHHGGGHSGASWTLCAKQLYELSNNKCDILAFDCRGHGRTGSGLNSYPSLANASLGMTVTTDDSNLSLPTLSSDLTQLIKAQDQSRIKEIVLVGHR
jgi:protein phosphatase methylesterase 1